ncbi:MAG: hypothetical protein ACR2P0_12675 [Acidimicrobiales bacterium]
MTFVVAALTVVVVLLVVLVAGLLRSHAEMLRAFNELGVTFGNDDEHAAGHTATIATPTRVPHASERVQESTGDGTVHDLAGTTPRGGAAAVAIAGRNERTLLAFLTSGCATCRNFWDAFRNDAALPRTVDRLVIVTRSNDEESPAALLNMAPDNHVVLMSSQAWDDYGVPVSPYFVLVDGPTSTIDGEGAASTWTQVGSLLSRAEADAEVENERRIDAELRAAGIEPNDPRLYPEGEGA